MINDIRFQASKLLEPLANETIQNTKDDFQEIYENGFGDVFQKQNINTDNSEHSSKTYMPLGIPANFLFEYSLIQEGFKEDSNNLINGNFEQNLS